MFQADDFRTGVKCAEHNRLCGALPCIILPRCPACALGLAIMRVGFVACKASGSCNAHAGRGLQSLLQYPNVDIAV